MAFDMNDLVIPETAIAGMDEAFDNWAPPPEFPPPMSPGKHSAIISEIREGSVDGDVLKLTLDFECKGANDEGDRIAFQRMSSRMFTRFDGTTTSQLLDVVKSSGIEGKPRTVKDIGDAIKHIAQTARLVNFQSDLQAYCTECANAVLLDRTGEVTVEAAKEALKNMKLSDPETQKSIYKEINKAGLKIKNYRSVPKNAETGKYADTVECPSCGRELRVQAIITRWLKPSTGPNYAEVPF